MLTPSVPALSSGLTTTGAPPRSAAQATAAAASAVFSASAVRRPARRSASRHRVLVAPRGAQRAAVGGQAEPLAERVGQRHARLGADDDEGRVVRGEPGRGRLQVALVDDVLDEVAGAEGARVEVGQARAALHVDDRQPGGGKARRQPRPGRVSVDDYRGAVNGHAVATRTRRSSGRFGPPAKLP